MAMNGSNLGSEIKAAIDALSSSDQADPLKVWQALGQAVVTHLQTNATVLIKSTDAGLQRDADGSHPDTLGPSTTKTLPGGAIQ